MRMRLIAPILGSVLGIALGMALVPESAFGQQNSPAQTENKIKAVRFGKLWDGKGKIWSNAIVIIDGDRVREDTTDSKRIPSGADLLDLSRYYDPPGLIDIHTHMTIYTA